MGSTSPHAAAPACAQHSFSDSMLHRQKAPHRQLCKQAPAQLTTCFTPQDKLHKTNCSLFTRHGAQRDVPLTYTEQLMYTVTAHFGGIHFACNKVGCMQRLLASPYTRVQLASAEGGCNTAVSCTVRLPATRKNKAVPA